MKHILVIGGAGYIGSVLTRQLLEQNYKVRVLDNLMYDNGFAIVNLYEHKHFSFIKGCFGDKKVLKEALNGITDVVLLAALVGDPICKQYPDIAKKTNLLYAKQLCDYLQDHGVIEKFIFISTCSNYGLCEGVVDETAPLNPLSLYAETKVEFEQYLSEKRRIQSGYSWIILRCATAFGISPRMRFDLTVSQFTKELFFNKKLLVYDEDTWRPYCHVYDIADAIIKVLKSNQDISIFNVGSDSENYTKKMLVGEILKHLPGKIIYKEGTANQRSYKVNFDKIKKHLNFEAAYTVPQSISALIWALKEGLYDDADLRPHLYANYCPSLKSMPVLP